MLTIYVGYCMSKDIRKTDIDYQALQEELERRYGPALAQEIVDQIRKAEQPDAVPDYMTVKAASEATELFRGETRRALKTLRKARTAKSDEASSRVVNLDNERAARELQRLFALYLGCQGSFYRLYGKAMRHHTEEIRWQGPARRAEQPTSALAA